MTLKPRSLWGRTLAVTVAAVLVAEILTLVSFNVFVLLPELNRLARATAESLVTISQAAALVGPGDRDRLVAQLDRTEWLDLRRDTTPPDDQGGRPRVLERVFMRALVEALGDREDLSWRTDSRGRLWVHLMLGPDGYWIGVKSLPRLGILGLLALCAAISAALCAIVATHFTTSVLKPMTTLRRASEHLTLTSLPPPLPEDGPVDVAAVTRSFNMMTRRLREADAERRLVLAGISHDVRSPLTKLRLALAMMPERDPELMASAERQLDAIERILSQFLNFSRGFSAEEPGKVSLRLLMKDIAERFTPEGVEVTVPAADWTFVGRTEALHRAVCNLVENALAYGAPPVTVRCEMDASTLNVVVSDGGKGFSSEQADVLRQPFVRGEIARSVEGAGTGLGLAIVDEVARLHGGRLEFASTASGFEARLCLNKSG